ncbi:MAG: ATPase [Lachnospiraceae bacterium]|nr:ATPase [Lachnospiraceae bacterium]
MKEITYQELQSMLKPSYQLVDIRDHTAVNYGIIPGAIHIPMEELTERKGELDPSKKIILYCAHGFASMKACELLAAEEIQADYLKGGYSGWMVEKLDAEKDEEDEASLKQRIKDIEHSIQKTFKKRTFSQFAKAINRYDMLQPGDKVAVCISGGKDSMLLAKLFQELKRHNKFDFELEFIVMDPGYSTANRKVIENNARIMGIPIRIFESDIFNVVYDIEQSPCYLCARMRRGYLYNKAKELGCNKIALGHHYDDVIETILMGMLYGGQVQTMMPKLHSTNFEGMELIRPMYLIREADVKAWRDYNDLHFIQCACRFTENTVTSETTGESTSKRQEIKQLIAELKKINPFIEGNIFKSVENVNLNTIITYKKNGIRHDFLEWYDEMEGEKD